MVEWIGCRTRVPASRSWSPTLMWFLARHAPTTLSTISGRHCKFTMTWTKWAFPCESMTYQHISHIVTVSFCGNGNSPPISSSLGSSSPPSTPPSRCIAPVSATRTVDPFGPKLRTRRDTCRGTRTPLHQQPSRSTTQHMRIDLFRTGTLIESPPMCEQNSNISATMEALTHEYTSHSC